MLLPSLLIGTLKGPAPGLPSQGTGSKVGNVLGGLFKPVPVDYTPINSYDNESEKTDYTVLIVAFIALLTIGGGFAYFLTRK